MGPTPSIAAPPMPAPSVEQAWLKLVQARVEGSLVELLELPDEAGLDARWTSVLAQAREYALRPTKRVRPAMLLAGYCLARGTPTVPAGLWRFAAGFELLHTFLLIHDDVADWADRGTAGRRSTTCCAGPRWARTWPWWWATICSPARSRRCWGRVCPARRARCATTWASVVRPPPASTWTWT